MQIFGRAGRPQYDTTGHAVLITPHASLGKYLGLLARQTPIESALVGALPDHLNAEVVNGTVTSIEEAAAWLSYTFLFVRMARNPLVYGLDPEEVLTDPQLQQKRKQLVQSAAEVSEVYMCAACMYCLCVLHVCTACVCCICVYCMCVLHLCVLHVCTACVYCMCVLHVCVAFVCTACVYCKCVLHVCTTCVSCICVYCMCVLHLCVLHLCVLQVCTACVYFMCVLHLCVLHVCTASVCCMCVLHV